MKEPKKKKQINVEIGSRIRQARLQQKITQEQLAELVDVTVQYISDLERGVTGTSVATIVKLCQVLNVSSDFLLMGKTSIPDEQLETKLASVTPDEKAAILDIVEKVLTFSRH